MGLTYKRHRTWAGTFFCHPERYYQPETLHQLQEIIRQANAAKKTIMVVGSGHSPSQLTMTRNWIVNLDKFNKVVKIHEPQSIVGPYSASTNGGRESEYVDVTVEAGMRIHELNKYLAANGLALQSLGSISDQSVAGVISTGTHGTSAYHGLISQQYVDLTVLTAAGELIRCSETDHPDLFRAAQLSLGKIGIIVYATIRTVPAFNLHVDFEVVSFSDYLENIWPTFYLSAEYTGAWWYPYIDRIVLFRMDKTKEPCTKLPRTWFSNWFNRYLYEFLLWVSVHIYPKMTPFIERWVFDGVNGKKHRTQLPQKYSAVTTSVQGFNMDCLFSQFVNEWAIPMTSGQKALQEMSHAIKDGLAKNKFYVHSPIELRVSNTTHPHSAAGRSPMSPTLNAKTSISMDEAEAGKGAIPGNNLRPYLDYTPKLEYNTNGPVTYDQLSFVINATMYRPFGTNSKCQVWYEVFEDIMYKLGGKPHWAKNFVGWANEGTNYKGYDGEMLGLKNKMEEFYGKDLEQWKDIRETYDPHGMFIAGRSWMQLNGLID